jgi:protease-4
MNFFKTFLASLAALAVVFFLLLLIFIGIIGSAVSSGEKQVTVPDNSILKIELKGQIVENYPANKDDIDFDFGSFGGFGSSTKKLGLYQLTQALEAAKTDDRIRGIYLNLNPALSGGQATMRTLYRALEDFKSSGKFIYAFGEIYTEKSLYLASLADEISIPPTGFVEFNGLAASPTYFTGMFEKLEIEPQIFRVGTYKSAVEPFFRKDMSEASREQTNAYLSVLWEEYIEDIAKARGMSAEDYNRIAEELVLGDGKEAVAAGLVDELRYEEDMINTLKEAMDLEESDKLKFISMKKYLKVATKGAKPQKDKVAVIFAEGQIQSGENSDGVMGSETIIKALRKARKDKSVKAVVLRVNSPGGSALASDMMAEEVRLTKLEKPVICSMGDVAASGGYYIAALADEIYADENTITGSIGIFGMFFTTDEMFEQKLGITFDHVETHQHADFGNPNFPLSEVERAMFQEQVNKGYGTFLGIVQKGRSAYFADSVAVDKVAQGRVWAGRTAKDLHLVDEYGNLQDAIAAAAEAANLPEGEYGTKLLPRVKTPMEEILESFMDAQMKSIPMYEEMKALDQLKRMVSQQGTYALMPQVEIR